MGLREQAAQVQLQLPKPGAPPARGRPPSISEHMLSALLESIQTQPRLLAGKGLLFYSLNGETET